MEVDVKQQQEEDVLKSKNIDIEDVFADTYIEEAISLFDKLRDLVEKQGDVVEELLLQKIHVRFNDAVNSINTKIVTTLRQNYKMAYGRIIILFTNYLAILMTSHYHISPLKLYSNQKLDEGMLTIDLSEFIYNIISDSTKLNRTEFAKNFELRANDPKCRIYEIIKEYENDKLVKSTIKTPYIMKKLFLDITKELMDDKNMIYKIESVSWKLIMSSHDNPNGLVVRSNLIVYAILDIKGLYTHFDDIVLMPLVKHDIPTKIHVIKHILGMDIFKAGYVLKHIDFGEYEEYAKNWQQ